METQKYVEQVANGDWLECITLNTSLMDAMVPGNKITLSKR